MLRIWGRKTSSNVQKVLWVCDEIGVPFERIEAGGSFGRVNDPDYRAMNPNGRVPTIEDDGFVLWESNTICRYLASKHAAHAIYPPELRARADVERWMDWGSTTLGPALHQAFWGLARTPAQQRDRRDHDDAEGDPPSPRSRAEECCVERTHGVDPPWTICPGDGTPCH